MLPYRENLEERLEASPLLVLLNHRKTAGRMAAEHWHPCLELLYVLDGEAEQTVGDSRFLFHAKDTLLIPSGAVHATRATRDDCYISVALFDPGASFPGRYLPAELGGDMEPLFSRMQEEAVLRRPGWQLVARGLLLQVLGLLERSGEPLALPDPPPEEGKRLEEYLRASLSGDLSLQKAAAYAGYSPAYFSRYFSRLMGMPFKVYVDRMRTQAAKGMLIDGLSTAAIADALGYETPSSFCRAFKRLTGLTPSEYQSQTQKMDRNR